MIRSFTVHALERMRGELFLNPHDVLHLLRSELIVPLGKEQGTNLEHRLFYSEVRDDWFVVVSNDKIKKVVTILPVEDHSPWKISTDALAEAKRIALAGCLSKAESVPKTGAIARLDHGPMVKISALIRETAGAKTRHIKLGRIRVSQFGADLDALMRNEALHAFIRQEIRRQLGPAEEVSALYFRLTDRGPIKTMRFMC